MLCPAHEALQKFSIVPLLTASPVYAATTLAGTRFSGTVPCPQEVWSGDAGTPKAVQWDV